MNLWLVGMMGSGKSTIGETVADSLGAPFRDTDELVEEATGESIADTWNRVGEEGFRRLESEAVTRAAGSARSVIATGGGAILDPANREVMKRTGTVVWLCASLDHLAETLGSGIGRPLLTDARDHRLALAALMGAREDIYMAVADHVVDVDGRSVEEIAEEVGALWS